MADTYASYEDLAAHETEGVDYQRISVPVTGATWASIAIHGGGIEPGSGEMAREVAAGLMGHYEFQAIKPSGNSVLHVTSTHFDEPTALAIVGAATRCLSFHGAAGDGTATTYLGGTDTVTGARVQARLQAAGFAVVDASEELNANDPANITNRTASGVGVQLEMSNALRASFFPNGDLTRAMRDSGQRTPAFYAYAAAVRAAFAGRGMVSQDSVNVSRYTLLPAGPADVDVSATVSTDALAVGGSHFVALVGRYQDASNSYLARVEFTTGQAVALTIRRRLAGTETSLGGGTVAGLTHAADRDFGVRLQITGSAIQARVWQIGTPEPTTWNVTAADTGLTAAGQAGTRSILSTANTNVLPVRALWSRFALEGDTQSFNVTRSVNGIRKAHPVGEDVRLATPAYVAL